MVKLTNETVFAEPNQKYSMDIVNTRRKGDSSLEHMPKHASLYIRRKLSRRREQTALPGNAWIQDITAALSADGIVQFLNLVEILGAQRQRKGDSFNVKEINRVSFRYKFIA